MQGGGRARWGWMDGWMYNWMGEVKGWVEDLHVFLPFFFLFLDIMLMFLQGFWLLSLCTKEGPGRGRKKKKQSKTTGL